MARISSKAGVKRGPGLDSAASLALILIPARADDSERMRAGARDLLALRLRYLSLNSSN